MRRWLLFFLAFIVLGTCAYSKSFIDIVSNAKNGQDKLGPKFMTGEYSIKDIDSEIKKISGNKNKKRITEELTEKDKDGYNALQLLMQMDNSYSTIEKLLKNLPDGEKEKFINKSFPRTFDNVYGFSDITPIFLATYEGDEELVKLLSENGADVNKTVLSKVDNYKYTPLYYAVCNKKSSVVDALLSSEKINVNIPFEKATGKGDICTPIYEAIKQNDTRTVEKLLKKADLNYKATFENCDLYGKTMTLKNWTPLLHALSYAEDQEIIELLVNNKNCDASIGGKGNSEKETWENFTPLHNSILRHDSVSFKLVYPKTLYSREKLTVRDERGSREYTPLQLAIKGDVINEDIVGELIDSERIFEEFENSDGLKVTCGEYLLERDDISENLRKQIEEMDTEVKIFDAIENCDYDTLHSALESGKNPNVRKKDKYAFEKAVLKAIDNGGKNGIDKIIIDLVQHGADPNMSVDKPMLQYIVDLSIQEGLDSNRREIIKLLLQCGANPDSIVENNMPLIPYVANKIGEGKNTDVLLFLLSDEVKDIDLEHPINVDSRIKGGNQNNWTALCISISNNNPILMAQLIDNGADLNDFIRQDSEVGFSPLGLAFYLAKEECADVLVSRGSNLKVTQELFGAKRVTLLMCAAATMQWGIINKILRNGNFDINEVDTLGKNAFMYVAEFNKNGVTIINNLRGRKADIKRKTNSNENAVSLAINNSQDMSIVGKLLEIGIPLENKISQDKLKRYKDTPIFELLNQLNEEI